jgi:hypothetical protein
VLAPVQQTSSPDGRARFRQLFRENFHETAQIEGIDPAAGDSLADHYLHRLADESSSSPMSSGSMLPIEQLRVLIVPGIIGDAAPNQMMPFGASMEYLHGKGYRIDYLPVAGAGTADHNAQTIADVVRDLELAPGERLVLMGYSKGSVDVMHFLVNHPSEASRVAGFVSLAGAVNGSPLADQFDPILIDILVGLSGGDQGDTGGLTSLFRAERLQWLATHRLPAGVKCYSMVAFTDAENISQIMKGANKQMSELDPRNDAQVIFYDAVVPGSTLMGYANGDHWAIALPFTEQATGMAGTIVNRNTFPRTALLETMLEYVRETLQ